MIKIQCDACFEMFDVPSDEAPVPQGWTQVSVCSTVHTAEGTFVEHESPTTLTVCSHCTTLDLLKRCTRAIAQALDTRPKEKA